MLDVSSYLQSLFQTIEISGLWILKIQKCLKCMYYAKYIKYPKSNTRYNI